MEQSENETVGDGESPVGGLTVRGFYVTGGVRGGSMLKTCLMRGRDCASGSRLGRGTGGAVLASGRGHAVTLD